MQKEFQVEGRFAEYLAFCFAVSEVKVSFPVVVTATHRVIRSVDDITLLGFQAPLATRNCIIRGDDFFLLMWLSDSADVVVACEIKERRIRVEIAPDDTSKYQWIETYIQGKKRSGPVDPLNLGGVIQQGWIDGTKALTILQRFEPSKENPRMRSIFLGITNGLVGLE